MDSSLYNTSEIIKFLTDIKDNLNNEEKKGGSRKKSRKHRKTYKKYKWF
jgi:hypothetical protein